MLSKNDFEAFAKGNACLGFTDKTDWITFLRMLDEKGYLWNSGDAPTKKVHYMHLGCYVILSAAGKRLSYSSVSEKVNRNCEMPVRWITGVTINQKKAEV